MEVHQSTLPLTAICFTSFLVVVLWSCRGAILVNIDQVHGAHGMYAMAGFLPRSLGVFRSGPLHVALES